MKVFETSSATLAALCIAGISSQANATPVTFPDFIAYNSGTDTTIVINSTNPQFYYDSSFKYAGPYSGYDASFGTLNSGLIALSGASGVGTVDPTLSYPTTGGIQVSSKGSPDGTGYIQLAFLNSSDQEEYGFASFDSNGDFLSITGNFLSVTYQTATPLPPSWMLLIAGLGVLGAVTHRRRRVAALPG